MAILKLSQLEIGDTVAIKEDGELTGFIVLKQGYPEDNNGRTLLLRYLLYDEMVFSEKGSNEYDGSDIDLWLSEDYLNLIDENIRSHIIEVEIPSQAKSQMSGGNGSSNGSSSGSGSRRPDTFRKKVFLLSYTEVGFPEDANAYIEGEALSYFDADYKRVSFLGWPAASWTLRSPQVKNDEYTWMVSDSGTAKILPARDSNGIRPAFTLPSTLSVFTTDADGEYRIATPADSGLYIQQNGSWSKASGVTVNGSTDLPNISMLESGTDNAANVSFNSWKSGFCQVSCMPNCLYDTDYNDTITSGKVSLPPDPSDLQSLEGPWLSAFIKEGQVASAIGLTPEKVVSGNVICSVTGTAITYDTVKISISPTAQITAHYLDKTGNYVTDTFSDRTTVEVVKNSLIYAKSSGSIFVGQSYIVEYQNTYTLMKCTESFDFSSGIVTD